MSKSGNERGRTPGVDTIRDGNPGKYGVGLELTPKQIENNELILARIKAQKQFIFETTKIIQIEFRKNKKTSTPQT